MIISKKIKYLLFSLFIASNLFSSEDDTLSEISKNSPWCATLGEAIEIERLLITSPIRHTFDMRKYLERKGKTARFRGEVYLAILDNGVKAVFKPRKEDELENSLAEVVAYKSAKCLVRSGFEYLLVPPTIMAEFADRKGSLQYFVESSFDLWKDEQREYAMSKSNVITQAPTASLFLATIGQWDQHPGNWLVTDEGIITLIDNEGIVNRKIFSANGNSYERPYVRIHFDEQLNASPSFKSLNRDIGLEEFASNFRGYLPMPRIRSLHSTFQSQDGGSFSYMIGESGVWIKFHANNPKAFPLVSKDYQFDDKVIDAFKSMLGNLEEIFDPLLEYDKARFSVIVSDVRRRFNDFLRT